MRENRCLTDALNPDWSATLPKTPCDSANSANDEWRSEILDWIGAQFPAASRCYVSEQGQDHMGNGSAQSPYGSIRHALTTVVQATMTHPLFILILGTLSEAVIPIVPHVHYIGLGSHSRIVGDLIQDETWAHCETVGWTYVYHLSLETLLFQVRSVCIPTLYLMGVTVNQRLQVRGYTQPVQCYLNDCVVRGSAHFDDAWVYSSANQYLGTVEMGVGGSQTECGLYAKQDHYCAPTSLIVDAKTHDSTHVRVRQSQIQGEVIAKGQARITMDKASYVTPHLQATAKMSVLGASILADRTLSLSLDSPDSLPFVAPQEVYHVAPRGDDEQGNGSCHAPFASLSRALKQSAILVAQSKTPCAIALHQGTYTEDQDIVLPPNVYILGNQSTVRIQGSIRLGEGWSHPHSVSLLRDVTLSVSAVIHLDFTPFLPKTRGLIWENVEFCSDTPVTIQGTGHEVLLFSGIDAIQFHVELACYDVNGTLSDSFLDSIELVNSGQYGDTRFSLCDSSIFLTASAQARQDRLDVTLTRSIVALGFSVIGDGVSVSDRDSAHSVGDKN